MATRMVELTGCRDRSCSGGRSTGEKTHGRRAGRHASTDHSAGGSRNARSSAI